MQTFKAAPQAGMAKSFIAAAIAGKLVEDIRNLGSVLVDVSLPGIPKVLACQFGATENWRERAYLERGRWMICGNVAGWICPLRVANASCGREYQSSKPVLNLYDFQEQTL